MSRRPPVTLLLPNRNNGPVLDLALRHLREHTTYPCFELVVVDDGSTDESLSILRRWRDERVFRDLTLIEREHGGVVNALNAGLSAAGGELIVQLDGDATAQTPGWLERMVDFQQSDERIGVVNPLITLDNGYVHAAGINVIGEQGLHDRGSEPQEPVGHRTLNTRVHRVKPDAAGALVKDTAEVDAAIGVCMLYPRAAAEELGGYDLGFSPVWFDDVDLSLSMRRLGLKAFFLSEVEFIHRLDLRNDRTPPSTVRKMRGRARRAVGQITPSRAKNVLAGIERRDPVHPPHELKRLRHHYRYWGAKWGFDLINPDMTQLLSRYGDTEVCWAYDPVRRAVGVGIVQGWAQRAN